MTPQGNVFQVNGVELFVKRQGEGNPFLWTHGLLGSMELEEETGVIEWSLLAKKVQIVRYDVRGHGKSGMSLSSRHYRWENLVYDAKELVNKIGFSTFIAGGQSMGAVISLFLALMMPSHVRGLVLVTPPALWEEGIIQGAIYEFAAKLLEMEGLERLLSLMKDRHDLADRQLISSPEITEKFVHSLIKRDPRVISAILRGAAQSLFPPREKLREVHIPTSIFAWTEDPLHPVSVAYELSRLIPSSRLHVAQNRREILEWSHTIVNFLAEQGEEATSDR
ncbi:MAG: alpha/beta hydrolase [Syntrophales bacterium]|nr:alpha/beta hydrolase [Syntrophales bacterium]